MKILITGIAGFIGFHTAKNLLNCGHIVYGIDNLNNYYDVNLKIARLNELGIESNLNLQQSKKFPNLTFKKLDIADSDQIKKFFEVENFDKVIHLAAQAGVRHSINNPQDYVNSNITGFLNILEGCRHSKVSHLIYASSSSVYGETSNTIFKPSDITDTPKSIYAATKKSNELFAYSYSSLFNLKVTGLRFFTVYGPWGRPDMAYSLFANSIYNNKPIDVYNYGNMLRDFTYIDDIVDGIQNTLNADLTIYKVLNLGNNTPVKLLDFITCIEKEIGKNALKNYMPIQDGDVKMTFADISDSTLILKYLPKVEINDGIHHFINWYKKYYNTTI